MRELIKKRHLVSIGIWGVCYMTLFLLLEIFEPESVHIISSNLDERIPFVPAFVYPYMIWFPYILVCVILAMRNLDDADYRKVVLILSAGMNVFLLISFFWPTGLLLREGLQYDSTVLSGWILKTIHSVDPPKSVFPSMHVYVTSVLWYSVELQKGRLPLWGIWISRLTAVSIIASTMLIKQHSVKDAAAAIFMFAVFWGIGKFFSEKTGLWDRQTA